MYHKPVDQSNCLFPVPIALDAPVRVTYPSLVYGFSKLCLFGFGFFHIQHSFSSHIYSVVRYSISASHVA